MFSTFKSRLLLGLYIFILLSIPVGAYLASQHQSTKSSASEPKTNASKTTTTSPSKELLSTSESKAKLESSSSASTDTSPTIATSFGPTLSLKVSLEGRLQTNQKTKLFVGILEGSALSNPKFLLTFMVDVPSSGSYGNLSLAGLSTGGQYTAILKGSAQIATASTFVMSPAETKLNSGDAVSLTSGDLNEDNVINTADYSIIQKAYGSTSASANWNENADLNKDGVINTFDSAIVIKNLGKIGDSGVWTSTIPKTATSSASLSPESSVLPVGSVGGTDTGYWLWIPK